MKSSLRPPLLYGLLAFSLVSSNLALAKTDWLDEMDKQFEETFQKSDQAFDRAMREGVQELDRELANIWGQARRLPEPKTWVGYSEDKTTRIIVDYEKGEMLFEGLDIDQDTLEDHFQDFLEKDSLQLDERAALRRKLINRIERYRQDDRAPAPRLVKRKIKTRPRLQSKPELSQLIEPKTPIRFIKRSVRVSKGRTAMLSRLSIPLRKNRDTLSAQALREPVINAAQKYNLPRALILSIIKNESSFNPRAHSGANALGLMQLVPTSGGKDAYSYLQGHEATPGPKILYDPAKNILLGTTYLHLLNTRYFGKVRDKMTRQFLIIAAYNTGAGNVAKAFTGKMKLKAAIKKINSMTPTAVYEHLLVNLPYTETRTYLARVARDTKVFASWDKTA